MATSDKARGDSKELLIEIEAFEQSYHIADHRAEIGRVDDEAILDLHGKIVRSSDQRHLKDKSAEVSLVCSQAYHSDPEVSESHQPMLMTASLVRGTFQALAYLPPKPFWALPDMIAAGRVSHVIADYRVGRRRDAMLQALYFASLENIKRQGLTD